MSAAPFDGWSPVRVFREPGDGWMVEWCRMGEQRFDDPFFSQTIDRALHRPFNAVFRRRTRLDDLGAALGGANARRPAGLIVHLSRCGSTLVAQTLAALPGSVVVSEAEPVDDILSAHRHDPAVTDEWRAERLRWIVTALGRSAGGEPDRFVLKLDPWHALDLPLIRRAFPGVPSIVVYRDPVEVLVSHEREPGWMTQLGHVERMLGLTLDQALELSRAEYRARILERLLQAMLRDDDPACRLVNHTELPGAAIGWIPQWFGIDPGSDGGSLMAAASRRDAKHPHLEHAPDSEEKQRRADTPIRTAAARLQPVYDALEARRRRQQPVWVGSRSENQTIPISSPSPAGTLRSRAKLPFAFDAVALAREALAFDEAEWEKHFNRAFYEGDWSGIPLRSPHGRLTIAPDPTGTAPYAETPYLRRCPAIRAVLAEIGSETASVRLLRLGAGARVREHQDYNIGVDYGFVRFHIPVITGPGVEFILGGEPLHMAAGECWYVDVWNAHTVWNPGPDARIHLVVDCVVDDALLAMLGAASSAPVAPSRAAPG